MQPNVYGHNVWVQKANAKEVIGKAWLNKRFIPHTLDINEFKKDIIVTLWSDVSGWRLPFPNANEYPYKEVMSFDFASDVTINGFSLWVNETEIFWQRIDVTIPNGGTLRVEMHALGMHFNQP